MLVMTKTKILYITILFILCIPQAWAQQILQGRVVNEYGTFLPQVQITDAKEGLLGSTNLKGSFRITVSEFPCTITFKKAGYEVKTLTVETSELLKVELAKQSESISEVYILGQSNHDKAYETAHLDGSKLINSFEANPINSLRGRVAGLQMTATAGGVTSGSGMVIRGQKSLVGSNQPLIVIDGIPIENETSGANQNGGQDWGNALKNLNMYDIDNVQVLKSAAAAIKYGSRGMNGVIELYTKGNNSPEGFTVETNLGGSFGKAFSMPELLNNETIQLINDNRLAWLSTASDKYYNSFDVANSQVGNIAASYTNDRTKLRLSYTADYNKGTYVRNTLDKNNLMLRANQLWTKKFQSELGLIYNNSTSRNAPSIGAQKFASLGRTFMEYPVDFAAASNNDPFESESAWHLYGHQAKKSGDTFRAFLQNSWQITDDLAFKFGGNYSDQNTRTQEYAGGFFERMLGNQSIFHQENAYRNRANETGKDWMLKGEFNYRLALEKQQFHASLGYDYWQSEGGINGQSFVPNDANFHIFKNGGEKQAIKKFEGAENMRLLNQFTIQHANQKSIHGAHLLVNYQYGQNFYANAGTRVDQVKTLKNISKLGNLTQVYPSFGLSYLYGSALQNWLKLPEKTLTYAKLRANWAYTGNVTGLYHYQSAVTDDLELPYPGLKSVYKPYYSNSGTWGLRNYQTGFSYEYARELELGTDVSLWSNRLDLHFTWYQRTIDNYLYDMISPLEQFNKPLRDVHAKVRNQGLEILVHAVPVQSKSFSWHSTLNLARNNNKFLALTSQSTADLSNLGSQNDVSLVASVNGNFGNLLSSYAPKTNAKGQAILNSAMEYVPAGEAKVIGNTLPKWIAGFENALTYKNFQVTALLDAKIGGDIYSGTHALLYQRGVLANTKFGRSKELGGVERKIATFQENPESGELETIYKSTFDGIIPQGVFDQQVYLHGKDVSGLSFEEARKLIGKDANGEYILQPLTASDYYEGFHERAGVRDRSVFENTYIALREVNLGYHLPSALARKWLHAEAAQVGLVGRNLGYIYKNLPYHLNPDGFYNNKNGGSFEYASLLPVRTFGMFVKINF
ncbi:TonB-dependent receptor plug domain-containing protein [Sphingobacterium humi]|uniref:TonB-dependent receptor plug domain-containing protein n=2 Tax=Sphingobacterium humi TaxID=1796905 RepID=A0A6N8L0Y3_9SPHI|nr:TonB-dependent receptor plug domain-containing protein [Sphingobacterium humi]